MFYVGLDLGQRNDPSAIAVVERVDVAGPYHTAVFESLLVRHVERAPLGTPYPMVVERMRQITGHAEVRGRCALAVDGTGVGAPVVDMLRAAGLGCEICAVTITGGARETQTGQGFDRTAWNVPKQDLMAGVQVLLERGELRIARDLPDLGSLTRELMDVRSTPGRGGRVRLGADGCGEHDDLVIALALAVWRAMRVERKNGFGTQRLPGI